MLANKLRSGVVLIKNKFLILIFISFSFLINGNVFGDEALIPFKDPTSGLSISFPPGWAISQNAEGLVVEAVEPKSPQEKSRASINVGYVDTSYDLDSVSDAEWKQVAQDIFQKAVPNVKVFNAASFTVNGKTGYEMAGKSTIQGKPIVLAQFYIPQKKRVYIITCAVIEAKLDALRPLFRKVVQSFKPG